MAIRLVHLMPTDISFKPERMRIMGNVLRMMGKYLGKLQGFFENLRIVLWAKKIA